MGLDRRLPSRDPELSGLEVAGICRAAEKIGGDYHGYVPLADGSTLVVIKGTSAAETTPGDAG